MPIVLDPGLSNPTAGASATSSDGKLTVYADTTYTGMLLSADFSALGTKPTRVRFYRGTSTVRSGDAAWASGGQAVAYDHEAPLGVASSWTAVPIFADGTTGTATTAAALTTPAMSDDVDCWIKPTADPGLSVAYQVHTDQIEVGWSGRLQSVTVPGRRYPIGSYDRRTPAPLSITLRTNAKSEKDKLAAACDAGPVLVQLRSSYGIDDFYAMPNGSTERYFAGMFSQLRDIPTEFVPIERPSTVESPLIIPGRSWADLVAVASTWSAWGTTWPTWWDILHGDAPVFDDLDPESGAADDEGSP